MVRTLAALPSLTTHAVDPEVLGEFRDELALRLPIMDTPAMAKVRRGVVVVVVVVMMMMMMMVRMMRMRMVVMVMMMMMMMMITTMMMMMMIALQVLVSLVRLGFDPGAEFARDWAGILQLHTHELLPHQVRPC
jgi:hypothetical protein